MAISFSGLNSGLDTTSWITSLTALKQAKVNTLQQQQEKLETSLQALNGIKSYFSAFRSMVTRVTDAKFNIASLDIFSRHVTTSSNNNVLTATATSEALEGTYNIKVDQLATNTEAVSAIRTNTTTTVTKTTTEDTYLKDLGVKTGVIDVAPDDTGITVRLNITESDTVGSFINKLKNIGVNASFNDQTSIFNVNIDVGNINDIGRTGIVSALKLTGVNKGYDTTNNLTYSWFEPIVEYVNGATKLSDVGVNAGTVKIETDDSVYNVELEDGDTIQDFIDALKSEGIEASINNGIFKIENAHITDDGSTNLINAFGLNSSDIAGSSQMSGELSYSTIISTTSDADGNTVLKNLGVSNGTITVRKDGVDYNFTINNENTLQSFINDLNSKGIEASIENGIFAINDAEIINDGTTGLISAFSIGAGTDVDSVQQKSGVLTYTTTISSTTAADGTTALSMWGVTNGNLIVTSNGETCTITVTSSMTLDDLVQAFKNNNLEASYADGILDLGDIKIESSSTTNLVSKLGIASTDVSYIYQESNALSYMLSVTSTIKATETTALKEFGVKNGTITVESYNANGDIQTNTIAISETMTFQQLINAFRMVNSSATMEDGVLSLGNVNIINEGTTGIKSALGISDTTSASNIQKSSVLKYTTIEVKTTTVMADTTLGYLGIASGNIVLSDKTQTYTVAVSTSDTLGSFINKVDSLSTFTASLTNGSIVLNGMEISDGSTELISRLGLTSTAVGTYTTGSPLKYTTIETHTTVANLTHTLGEVANAMQKTLRNGNIVVNDLDRYVTIAVSSTDTVQTFLNKFAAAGLTGTSATMENGIITLKGVNINDVGGTNIVDVLSLRTVDDGIEEWSNTLTYFSITYSATAATTGIQLNNLVNPDWSSRGAVSAGTLTVEKLHSTVYVALTGAETLGDLINKFSAVGITARLSAGASLPGGTTSLFTIEDAEITNYGGTNLNNVLGLTSIRSGQYDFSDAKTASMTVTVLSTNTVANNTGGARLSNGNLVLMNTAGNYATVNLAASDTYGSVVTKLQNAGFTASLTNGVFSLQDAKIVTDNCNFVNALGLANASGEQWNLYSSTLTRQITGDTVVSDWASFNGKSITNNGVITLKDLDGNNKTVTVTTGMTFGTLASSIQSAGGAYASASISDGKLIMNGVSVVSDTSGILSAMEYSSNGVYGTRQVSGNLTYSYNYTVTADGSSTLGEVSGASGSGTIYLSNSSGSFGIDVSSGTNFSSLISSINSSGSPYGISASISNGVLTISGATGISGSSTAANFVSAFGMTTTITGVTQTSKSLAVIKTVTTIITATASTTLGDLGLGDTTIEYYLCQEYEDLPDYRYYTVTYDSATTIGSIFNLNSDDNYCMKAYDVSLSDGVLTLSGKSIGHRYRICGGTLINALGLNTDDDWVTAQRSTVAIEYTEEVTGYGRVNPWTRMVDIIKVNDKSVTIKAGDTLGLEGYYNGQVFWGETITITSTMTLEEFNSQLSDKTGCSVFLSPYNDTYQIDTELLNINFYGTLKDTFDFYDGLSGALYSKGYSQYNRSVKATGTSRLGSIYSSIGIRTITIKSTETTSTTEFTVDSSTTIDELIAKLAQNGITAYIQDGYFLTKSTSGKYMTSDSYVMHALNMDLRKNVYYTGLELTGGGSATSGVVGTTSISVYSTTPLTISITATSSTTLGDLGLGGTTIEYYEYYLGRYKTVTYDSTRTIGWIFNCGGNYNQDMSSYDGSLSDGVLTLSGKSIEAQYRISGGTLITALGLNTDDDWATYQRSRKAITVRQISTLPIGGVSPSTKMVDITRVDGNTVTIRAGDRTEFYGFYNGSYFNDTITITSTMTLEDFVSQLSDKTGCSCFLSPYNNTYQIDTELTNIQFMGSLGFALRFSSGLSGALYTGGGVSTTTVTATGTTTLGSIYGNYITTITIKSTETTSTTEFTVAGSTTIDELIAKLAQYGITACIKDGYFLTKSTSGKYIDDPISGIRFDFRSDGHAKCLELSGGGSAKSGVVGFNTVSTYSTTPLTISGDKTLAEINILKAASSTGSILVHKSDGTTATVNVSGATTVDSLKSTLSGYGLSLSWSGNYLYVSASNDTYITSSGLGSSIIASTSKTGYMTSKQMQATKKGSGNAGWGTQISHLTAGVTNGNFILYGNGTSKAVYASDTLADIAVRMGGTWDSSQNAYVCNNASYKWKMYFSGNQLVFESFGNGDTYMASSGGSNIIDKLFGNSHQVIYNYQTNAQNTKFVGADSCSYLASVLGATTGNYNILNSSGGVVATLTTSGKTIDQFKADLAAYGISFTYNQSSAGTSFYYHSDNGYHIADSTGNLISRLFTKGGQTKDRSSNVTTYTRTDNLGWNTYLYSHVYNDGTNSSQASLNTGMSTSRVSYVRNASGTVLGTISTSSNETLATLRDKIAAYGITLNLSGNVLSYETSDGKYLDGDILNLLNHQNIVYDYTSTKLQFIDNDGGKTYNVDWNTRVGHVCNSVVTAGTLTIKNIADKSVHGYITITRDMTMGQVRDLLAAKGIALELKSSGGRTYYTYTSKQYQLENGTSNLDSTMFTNRFITKTYTSNETLRKVYQENVTYNATLNTKIGYDTSPTDIYGYTNSSNGLGCRGGLYVVVKNGVRYTLSVDKTQTLAEVNNQIKGYGLTITTTTTSDGTRFIIDANSDVYLDSVYDSNGNLASNASDFVKRIFPNMQTVYRYDAQKNITYETIAVKNATLDTFLTDTRSYTIQNHDGTTTNVTLGFDGTIGLTNGAISNGIFDIVNSDGSRVTQSLNSTIKVEKIGTTFFAGRTVDIMQTIISGTTIGDFIAGLNSAGLVAEFTGGCIRVTGPGNMYIDTSTGSGQKSNLVSELFNNEKHSTYNYSTELYNKDDNDVTYDVNTSTKLTQLGITTGKFNLVSDGRTVQAQVTQDMTFGDLKSLLETYGINMNLVRKSDGVHLVLDAYSNSKVEAYTGSGASNLITKIGLVTKQTQYDYSSGSITISSSVTETVSASGSMLLSDFGIRSGQYYIVKDGVKNSLYISSDETFDSFMNTLKSYGIASALVQKADGVHFELTAEGDTYLESATGSGASNVADILAGNTVKLYDYSSGLSVTSSRTATVEASDTSLLRDFGITSGEYYIYSDGVKIIANISNDDTFASLTETLAQFGLRGSLVKTDDGVHYIVNGDGNSYLARSNSSKASNLLDQIFTNGQNLMYNYESTLTTEHTETHTIAATEDTLLSQFDTATLKAKGKLALVIDGKAASIEITSDETFGSLIEKFAKLGITATLSNEGRFVINSGFNNISINTAATTSNIMLTLGLGANDNLGGFSASSDSLSYNETIVADKTLSVANYADLSTQMGLLNISSGVLSVYRDGIRASIQVDKEESFAQLRSRINGAFAQGDVDIRFVDGSLEIFSTTDGVKVEAGTTTDTSNFYAICGLTSNGDSVFSSRELYKVNGTSTLTNYGLFRKGNVSEGTFVIGGATFNITSTTTLNDVISMINSSDKANATAYWDAVEGKLVLKSRTSGYSLINVEAGTSNFTDIMGLTTTERKNDGSVLSTRLISEAQQMGVNAIFEINGTKYTSTANHIESDVSRLTGITLDLRGAAPGEEITLTVERDKETVATAVSDIVDAYNELIQNVDAEVSKNGNLNNQSALKMLRNRIRSLMTSSLANPGAYRTLSQIGIGIASASAGDISTDNINALSFDAEKFMEQFVADPDSIKALLVGTDEYNGIFTSIDNILENALGSVSGYFETAANSYNNQIMSITEKISRANAAVERYRQKLEYKFGSMDILIGKMQQQYQSFLS